MTGAGTTKDEDEAHFSYKLDIASRVLLDFFLPII
jgi:hypothetical protein